MALVNIRLSSAFSWIGFFLNCCVLAGCAAHSPKIVVDENGLAYSSVGGSYDRFAILYNQLHKKTVEGNPIDPRDAGALVKSGASLAYQQCSSFFKSAGTDQQYLLFSRDLVGLIGTVATGVLGATRATPAATAAVGIGSGAALSGISIYSREFLFSEDNVQAVQNLTLTAMSAVTAEALKRADYDFDTAIDAIMDIQSVCEVQHILSLVRQSITSAKPEATVSATPTGSRINVDVPSAPTSGDAPKVPKAESQVAATAPLSRHIEGAIPVSVDPLSVEPFLSPPDGRAIEAALCLKPDAATVQFGPATRDAIAMFRTTGGHGGPTNALTADEASLLIKQPACDNRQYRNAFEYFQYPTSDRIKSLQRTLASQLPNGPAVASTGILDAQTRAAIGAIQELRCQSQTGSLTRGFMDSLLNPVPKSCPTAPAQ